MREKIILFLAVAIISLFVIVHCLNVNADTPVFLSEDAGAYCDEGYKTLDARNYLLFNDFRWTEYDEYGGWFGRSPVTVISNVIFFKLFGVSVAAARLVSLVFATGSLLLVLLIFKKISNLFTAFTVMFFTAINEVYFFYSRLAIFEIKMIFFILLSLYLGLFIQKQKWFIFPAFLAWLAAFYSKETAILFLISFIIYSILFLNNGFLVRRLLRPAVFLPVLIVTSLIISVLHFIYLNYYELYMQFLILERNFRSPLIAILDIVTSKFFTKNPVLTFLAFLYSGYLLNRIAENKLFKKIDVLFLIWILTGVTVFSIFTYQPLRYYIYFSVPLIYLGVRAIFNLQDIGITLFSPGKLWLRLPVFVGGLYLLIIHGLVLRLNPIKINDLWQLTALYRFGIISLSLIIFLTVLYWLMIKKNIRPALFSDKFVKFYRWGFIILIGAVHLYPLSNWLLNRKYELLAAMEKIQDLGEEVKIAGDWAPQFCINTRHKVLYTDLLPSQKDTKNYRNLDKVQPDYLVIVEDINEYLYENFRKDYPGVCLQPPALKLQYAGRNIFIYKLQF